MLYSKVNQLYVHIYPLFFKFFSHIGYYGILNIEFSVLYSWSLFVIYFIYSNEYVSIPVSQFIPPLFSP